MTALPAPYTAHPAHREDIEEIWRVMTAANLAEAGAPGWGLGEIENWLTGVPIVIEEDVRVLRDGAGGIVAVEIFHLRDPFVRPFAVGGVHPDHVGRGLGTALLGWACARAEAQAAKAPPETRIVFVSFTAAGHEPSEQLMRDAGLEPSRFFIDMEIEFDGRPPPPLVPADVTIRPFAGAQDLAGLARAHLASFQDHYGHVPTSEARQMEQLAHWASSAEHDPALWWMATADGEIVGFNLCEPSNQGDEDVGFVSSLGVLRAHRRRGLATALLLTAFNEFFDRGKRGAALGVDAESLTGATRLYESVGMHAGAEYASWELEIRSGIDLATAAPPE